MTGWEERKRAELAAKLTSLKDDLRAWTVMSRAGGALEKNHTQLERLETDFLPVADRLVADSRDEVSPERWRVVERAVTDLLSVWGYFRDKLAVRLVPGYGSHLAAADDFAWACSLPAHEAAVAAGQVGHAAVREPPLVCLDDVTSPYSLARGTSFEGELAAAQRLSPSSRLLLRRLPIPVIAVPWFQLRHLPDLLVVAHEVGHHLLRDLALEEPAAEIVGAVSSSGPGPLRQEWAAEMFCDVVGTVSAGRAFVSSLADFLRAAEVTADGGAVYPPTSVRLALCLGVLELDDVGSAGHAAGLEARWAAEGVVIPADDRTAGAAAATALATTTYAGVGKRLVELQPFTAAKESAADDEVTELLAARPTRTRDIRVLLAAAALAFGTAPDRYRDREVGTRALEMARRIREPGVRRRAGPSASGAVRAPAGPVDSGLVEDGLAGEAAELYELLMSADAGADPGAPPWV